MRFSVAPLRERSFPCLLMVIRDPLCGESWRLAILDDSFSSLYIGVVAALCSLISGECRVVLAKRTLQLQHISMMAEVKEYHNKIWF